MIEVKSLKKSYGDLLALNDVSFSIKPGEIIGLLGPNGAGKTTLMQILTGYLHPSAGTVEVGGLDVVSNPDKVQKMIGYLPENAPIYNELTVQSYLRMIADLRRIPADEQKKRLSAAIRAVGLQDRLTKLISTLSKGYRQRVGLAQAILHTPSLLVLDEPTTGLDPTQIVEVRHLIRELAKNSTVILSTHILPEVEATCDRAIIIMRGEVKADARLSELAGSTNAVVTLATDNSDETRDILGGIKEAKGVEIIGQADGLVTYRVFGRTKQNLCPLIYRLSREHDWLLYELKKDVRTLEAVFNELAGAEGGAR